MCVCTDISPGFFYHQEDGKRRYLGVGILFVCAGSAGLFILDLPSFRIHVVAVTIYQFGNRNDFVALPL